MERGAAKLAKLRLAQTDAAPFPAPGTADTARSTGLHCNGHFKSHYNGNDNGNGNGNDNGNGNCRCAHVKSHGNNLPLPSPLANKPLFFESFSRNTIKPVIR